MKIKIQKKLYQIVIEKYSSFDYILQETLPLISLENLTKLCINFNKQIEVVEVDIDEEIIDTLKEYKLSENSIDELINYIISVGYVMEV